MFTRDWGGKGGHKLVKQWVTNYSETAETISSVLHHIVAIIYNNL